MDNSPKKRLGDLLREAGILDDLQLKSALSHQQQWGGRLGAILLKLNMVTEEKLVGFLARQFRLPVMDLSRVEIQPGTLQLVPKAFAIKHQVLPLFKDKEGEREYLAVAMANPGDLSTLDELRFATRLEPKPIIASDPSLVRAIDYYYLGNGIAPYDPGSLVSSKMTMKDVVRITRDFLSSTRAAAGESKSEEHKPSDSMIGVSTLIDNDDEEESVLVFTGGEETAFSLDDSVEAAAPEKTKTAPATDKPLDSDRILRALIAVLEGKDLVTKAEIRKAIKDLS